MAIPAAVHPLRTPPETANGEGAGASAKKQKRECQEFEPRSYEVAVYEVALRRNTIAVMDTGSGKMMSASKRFEKELKMSGDRWLVIFPAPTVHHQSGQLEVRIPFLSSPLIIM
ncbi:endoribonuclease Dicer homolog 3a-like [Phoenix dactylifera]|uniref:Endoribonuclease Dicer homolog 3a-like n=1 Tax=Phoenix dactylifera TaxID=42345 RepID=A0A8B9AME1_PHODC|nr:endoribonuclease Dicer homolog 3a-like [Phoenix dactylifera]